MLGETDEAKALQLEKQVRTYKLCFYDLVLRKTFIYTWCRLFCTFTVYFNLFFSINFGHLCNVFAAQ